MRVCTVSPCRRVPGHRPCGVRSMSSSTVRACWRCPASRLCRRHGARAWTCPCSADVPRSQRAPSAVGFSSPEGPAFSGLCSAPGGGKPDARPRSPPGGAGSRQAVGPWQDTAGTRKSPAGALPAARALRAAAGALSVPRPCSRLASHSHSWCVWRQLHGLLSQQLSDVQTASLSAVACWALHPRTDSLELDVGPPHPDPDPGGQQSDFCSCEFGFFLFHV